MITTSEANRLSFSDEEQLIWATDRGRVVYSFKRRDFSRLYKICIAEERSHTEIILAQQERYSVGAQLRGLLNLIAAKSAEEMIDQLEYLGTYIRDE